MKPTTINRQPSNWLDKRWRKEELQIAFAIPFLAFIGTIIFGGYWADMAASPGGMEVLIRLFKVMYIAGVSFVVFLVPIIIGVAGRLRDININPWWSMLSFIPYIGIIFVIVLCFLPGTHGPNRYGPDPRSPIILQ